MGIQEIVHTPVAALQEKLSFVSTDPLPWKNYVIASSTAVWAFETYLLLRQYPNYSKTAPPGILKEHFETEKFQKSQIYGRHKAKFSLVSSTYRQIIDVAFIYFGIFAWAYRVGGELLAVAGYGPEYEILHSIAFALIYAFVHQMPSIPLSVYQTFIIEAEHGFNKTTVGTFITDMLKSWFLIVAIGGPFLSAFLWIFRFAGDHFVPYLMAFMVAFQVIMVFLIPLVIQPFFNKLSPLQPGELRDRIEALARRMRFPLKHLYEIDGSKRSNHSNAYFFGLPWSKHIVIFDTLIKQAKPEEVEAILAHELGHWYYYHPTKGLLINQLHILAIIGCFPAFLHSPPLLLSFDFPSTVAVHPPVIVAFLLYQLVIGPLDTLVQFGMYAVMRKFEYQADRFACELDDRFGVTINGKADMGERLGQALIAIHIENLSTVWVDWLFSAYHHVHPTLMERLKALDEHQTRSGKKAQ